MAGEEIKSRHVAVYALSLLGGAHQKVHTEDVAQKCLEIAPDRFRWEKYKYPDKELVRKALFHASEKKNGSLVTGRAGIEQRGKTRDGWQLTPAGAAWIHANEKLFERAVSRGSRAEALPKREAERVVRKLRTDAAFQSFEHTGTLADVNRYMFTDMLNCSPDAPPETIRVKFSRLLSTAELIGDQQIVTFLNLCERQFAGLVSPASAAGGGQ
jgi:hypothetical protein